MFVIVNDVEDGKLVLNTDEIAMVWADAGQAEDKDARVLTSIRLRGDSVIYVEETVEQIAIFLNAKPVVGH
jgi:hypothetical protein